MPAEFDSKRIRVEYKVAVKYGDMQHPQIISTGNGGIYALLSNKDAQNYTVTEFCH